MQKIIFIGCRNIGYDCLKLLLDKYPKSLAAIYTLHPKLEHKTAGYKDFRPLLKKCSIQSFFVRDINNAKYISKIKSLNPDLIIQVGWSQIINDKLLSLPRLGCIGFHSSLLPKDRGGSPVNWAIIRGEKRWGVTLFYLEPGVDNGDIITQKRFRINLQDTAKTVYQKSGLLMVQMLKENVPLLLKGCAPRIVQKESEATYNKRRSPEDGLIDWKKGAFELYNWIRALTHPYPGAFTYLGPNKLFIWKVGLRKSSFDDKIDRKMRPGTIKISPEEKEVFVKTADAFLVLERIQKEKSSEIDAYDFLSKVTKYKKFNDKKI